MTFAKWYLCLLYISAAVSRCAMSSASATLQKLAAVVRHVSSRADVDAAAALAGDATLSAVIMDAVDWQSIPAENLVAAFQVQLSCVCLWHLALVYRVWCKHTAAVS
jgi:3-dehydroquinate synthase class II